MVKRDQFSCMEVWGGAGPTNKYFQRPGLDLRVWSNALDQENRGGREIYLVSSCASGRITRVILTEVCGFGEQLVEIADELRQLMSRNINTIGQSRLVDNLNQHLEEVSDVGVFASSIICTYFAPSRTLSVCNTGQPPPLVYRARSGEWTVLKNIRQSESSPTSFGVTPQDEYQEFKSTLGVGDLILNYSNALTECRDEHGRILGVEGLLSLLKSMRWQESEDRGSELISVLKDQHPDNLVDSDAVLLLCQATKTGTTWRDNLAAPIRLFRPVTFRTSDENPSNE